MKTFARSVLTMMCFALAVLFLPSSGMTVFARTISAGERVEVTSLNADDVIEAGVELRCPDTHALTLYVDGIHRGVGNPFTTKERYRVVEEAHHDNNTYWLKVSTWFPGV